eukprot:Amastigsp_a515409_29.p4 type:complete len:110 gc:universal Amastigsp_a515409_29:1005-1334(+)
MVPTEPPWYDRARATILDRLVNIFAMRSAASFASAPPHVKKNRCMPGTMSWRSAAVRALTSTAELHGYTYEISLSCLVTASTTSGGVVCPLFAHMAPELKSMYFFPVVS